MLYVYTSNYFYTKIYKKSNTMQYIVVKNEKKLKYSYLRVHGTYRKHQENGGFPGESGTILFYHLEKGKISMNELIGTARLLWNTWVIFIALNVAGRPENHLHRVTVIHVLPLLPRRRSVY